MFESFIVFDSSEFEGPRFYYRHRTVILKYGPIGTDIDTHLSSSKNQFIMNNFL